MAFKILSLDGGGTWALIQARIIFNKYSQKYGTEVTGHQVLRDYDLVIANSGGSLVLSMMCADKKLSEIVSTFNDTNVLKSIFKKKLVSHIPKLKEFLPNYETANKLVVFRKFLENNGTQYGDVLMVDLPGLIGKPSLQIIITTFDYDRERATYFRSNYKSMMEGYMIQNKVQPGSAQKKYSTVKLANAIHAASNAPVQFFDDPASFNITEVDEQGIRRSTDKKRLFWDGAVGGNNNPVKAGVLEALANGAKYDDIHIVSIGTANTVRPVLYNEPNEARTDYSFLCCYSEIGGWIQDLGKMARSILSDPPDAATFECHQILGLPYEQNAKRLIRINPLVKPILVENRWTMPGKGNWLADEMETLFTMDMAIASEEGVRLINKLCDDYFNDGFDNQGIRLGGEKHEAILGHKLYTHAMMDWD